MLLNNQNNCSKRIIKINHEILTVYTSLPIVSKVEVMTKISVLSSKAKRRGTPQASTTSWIHSLGPSMRYERAKLTTGNNLFVVVSQGRSFRLPNCRNTGMRKVVMAQVHTKLHKNHLTIKQKRKDTNCLRILEKENVFFSSFME